MRDSTRWVLLVTAVVLMAAVVPAKAITTIVYQPEDTVIYEGYPDRNYGEAQWSGNSVRTGNPTPPSTYRTLVKFDLAGNLPANAVIDSATFSVRTIGGDTGNIIWNFYRVTNSWVEGTGYDGLPNSYDNGVIEFGSVSWNSREHDTLPWNTPGGDFDPAWLSLNQSMPVSSLYSWPISDGGGLAILQDWVDNPADNHGFLIDLDQGPGNSNDQVEVTWYSSEQPHGVGGITDAERPQLVVDYTPAGPTVVVPSDIATAVEIFWSTSNGVNYQVQFTDDIVSSNWFELGSFVTGDGGEEAVFDSARGVTGRAYRVTLY